MKKGKIIQDIKTNTSMPVLISTLFYVFLASFFIEGGLWLSSELVGPFSLGIGFLVEFFSPGNGTASIQEFFYHYLLYYELFSFVIILFLFIFWVKVIEKNALSSLGFVKRNWLKYLVWGILMSLVQMGVIALIYQVSGIGTFELNELSLEPLLFIYTDSIWLVVAQHGTWNYVQGNLLGFQVSGTGADASIFSFTMGDGPDWLTGGAFGAEGSIITTLVLLVSLVIVYRLGERKEKFDD